MSDPNVRVTGRHGVIQVLVETARQRPRAVALIDGDRHISYGTLEHLSAGAADHLRRQGLRCGDVVALVAANGVPWILGYSAVLRCGGCVAPLDVLLPDQEIVRAATAVGARVILAGRDRFARLAAGCERQGIILLSLDDIAVADTDGTGTATTDPRAGDVATVLLTPGVTEPPKAVALSHANLGAAACDFAADVAELGPGDVVATALPLSHAAGLTLGLNAAWFGGSVVLPIPRFEASEVLRRLARDEATVLVAAAETYHALVQSARHADVGGIALTRCVAGGGALGPTLLRAVEEVFGCVVLEGYGLSETAAAGAFNRLHGPRRTGTAGPPMAGATIGIVDPAGAAVADGEIGEIVIGGDYVMTGYADAPQATRAVLRDGRLFTGDLGRLDTDGSLVVVERKDQIIRLPEGDVHPTVVERALMRHPAVREAAVIAVGDEHGDRVVGAAVVLRDAFDVDPEALQVHAIAHLAAHERPRHIWFVDELPRGAAGKVLRRELQAPAGAPEEAV